MLPSLSLSVVVTSLLTWRCCCLSIFLPPSFPSCCSPPPKKQAVDPTFGGSSAASLDAVVAKLTRAKAGKGYHSAREALLLNGRFVLAQVCGKSLALRQAALAHTPQDGD